MKHWIVLAGIVLLGVAAVVISERRKVDVEASPDALLYLVADTEQELTRMPVRFTRMSDEDEIRIGNQIARRSYGAGHETQASGEEAVVQTYLMQVGSRLAAHAHRKLPWRFHYIPEKNFVNAFALPGGHVYIGRGLLALMDSEDELASVLGHEIEHIDHYHCTERVQQEQALRRIPFGEFVALPVELFEAGYTKDQELEADREGTRLAVQAGYSPNGAIRMFEAFQRLYEEYGSHARTPEEELSKVAQQVLSGYFRSHPPASERIAQIQQLIASEGWPLRAERDLAVSFVFWTSRAEDALNAHRYPQAQQIALRSLQMRPGQERALWILGRAQFAQADFAGAADSLRKALAIDHSDGQLVTEYALALATANHQDAAARFQNWVDSLSENDRDPHEVRVPAAGLALLAGESEPARSAAAEARSHIAEEWAPQWLGELGGWYYMAGSCPTALSLLDDALQQRPDEPRFSTVRAWVQIQDRKPADALDTLNSVYNSRKVAADALMARAVAQWLAHDQSSALFNFAAAINRQPEWKDPRWVNALYTPLVAETVQQMHAEQQRQTKTAEKSLGHPLTEN